ncbi:family 20 glycosylhydrolase [Parabacteroides bouchesdurhonensis]|uniref:glycoside hydrolase family 20 protein n=1 Tax=Parabacteroides bouchesdurhonensis TaxID=1936995 RepID=UPI000E4ED791|nr:family 20 glycosylhydrolase [Parabacteroides bouchesdurhonensis]RHJ90634.1 beta-N-acetylhexosaminidase [Bacteroides sp. AM07-16]
MRPSKQLLKPIALWAVVTVLFMSACTHKQAVQVNLIPKPAEMEIVNGYFLVEANQLMNEGESTDIRYIINKNFDLSNPEAYRLKVSHNGIEAEAATDAGLFYARQTLRQLLTDKGIPYVDIHDAPRFPYRGLHLDVSRHFFPKEEILKLLDIMSYYKLNNLHMHLTDAGGWRIQMDKYPKLTSETAFRTESDWQKWWDGKDRKYLPEGTPGAYGGYYTKDDIREIVAYAAERYINIIPEVEFPGHSDEVLFAYPELSCSGKPYMNGDFCIGNPKTFTFMEDVLSEVIDLFPSEYIHVGGDEAGKGSWKTCPKCQALMKKEGMKDVDELQSYMIHKAEEFLISKGRKLIGWDEILEGGLAPEATVMSWRGENGGIKSARMGHDVIMTPGGYMYFDFYQADPKTQPYAIGGYTPVKHVYSYNPVPVDSLTAEESKHIIGVQANTWTEYIQTADHLEYMMFPRVLALAEIAWTPQEQRSWQDFKPRMNANIPVLQKMGINTFTLSDEIETVMKVDTVKKQIEVVLDAEKYPAEIRYTTDGTTPTVSSTLYTGAIAIKDSAYIKAAIFRDGKLQGTPTEKKVDYHRGINKPIHYNSKLYSGYMAGGMNALLDGYRGGLTYLDGRWQGYLNDLDCVVDMEEVTGIHKVSIRFMQLIGPGVFQPGKVELLTSEDGENFIPQGVVPTTISNKDKDLSFQEYIFFGDWKARYVRLKATEVNNAFIFTDEIVIW